VPDRVVKIKKSIIDIFDLLFLSRPVVLVPVWGFSVYGYLRATYQNTMPSVSTVFSTIHLSLAPFGAMAVFSCSVAAIYILNQITDMEVDRENDGLAMLVQGKVEKWKGWAGFTIFAAGSCVGTYLIDRQLLLFALAALIVGVAYSVKPFYFTGRPFLDFVSNAVGYGIIAFGAGWHIAEKPVFSSEFICVALPYLFMMAAGSISSTLPDTRGDRLAEKKTTAVVLGRKKAHLLSIAFLCAGLLAALRLSDPYGIAAALLTIPWYCIYLVKPTRRWMEATYKIGGAVFLLVGSIFFPLLAAAGLIVFGLTMIYHFFRFGIIYPSLIPDTPKGKNE
jgi:4-hydroxybenzoate polyprenyltransferase